MPARRKHWKAEAAELVRLADPGRRGPIYLLSVQQAAAIYKPNPKVFGFTGLLLCHRLRRAIGRKWQGPGFCAVIDIRHAVSRLQWLGAVLHEYVHQVVGRWEPHLAMLAELRLERQILPRRRPGQAEAARGILRARRVRHHARAAFLPPGRPPGPPDVAILVWRFP